MHTNTELIISSLITLLILHLPADSAIYQVSLQKRRSGNETDVCKGAFWVICLIWALMGREGIKRLKQYFSFSSFTYPSSFPSHPLLTKMSRSWLLFSTLAFNAQLNVNGAFSHTKWNSSTSSSGVFSSPMTFCSPINSFWPLNSWHESPEGSKIPQQVDSGNIGVASWHYDIIYCMSTHRLATI